MYNLLYNTYRYNNSKDIRHIDLVIERCAVMTICSFHVSEGSVKDNINFRINIDMNVKCVFATMH